MLKDALDHPKVHNLAERLGVNRPQAIGHLELLWAFTASKAPAGDIGKWPLASVAQACDWFTDPAKFIEGLVATRLVDEHPVHKFVIHDWHDHCPRYVKARVKALGTGFASLQSATTGDDSRPALQSATTGGHSKPSQAKPSQALHSDPPTAMQRTNRKPPDEWTPDPNAAARGGSNAYPDETALMDAWATVMATYPVRAGRTHWLAAEHHWRARIDEGNAPSVLFAGVERYAAYVAGGGVSGPQFVLGPEKFFGDVDKPWSMPWVVPVGAAKGDDARVAGNLAAAQEWLAKGNAS
jgi:hypothetical protein